jgi:hypothetical protein
MEIACIAPAATTARSSQPKHEGCGNDLEVAQYHAKEMLLPCGNNNDVDLLKVTPD